MAYTNCSREGLLPGCSAMREVEERWKPCGDLVGLLSVVPSDIFPSAFVQGELEIPQFTQAGVRPSVQELKFAVGER